MKNQALFSKITLASTVVLLATGVVAPSIGAKVTFADDTAITEKDKVLTPAEISAMYKTVTAALDEYSAKWDELKRRPYQTQLTDEQLKKLEQELAEHEAKGQVLYQRLNAIGEEVNKYARQFYAEDDPRFGITSSLVRYDITYAEVSDYIYYDASQNRITALILPDGTNVLNTDGVFYKHPVTMFVWGWSEYKAKHGSIPKKSANTPAPTPSTTVTPSPTTTTVSTTKPTTTTVSTTKPTTKATTTQTTKATTKPVTKSTTKPTTQLSEVYRLYHAGLKVHLYTTDKNEHKILQTRGWKSEGIAWKTEKEKGEPVYRLYHPVIKYHFYTKDANEYKVLGTRGWKQEGIAYRSSGTVPVYRLYHAGLRKHLFTKDANEYKVLGTRGWKQEGIAWYGQP
ncbi:hypothetical protein [Streptococcus ovis]|uniref:hypothetical protein n=1 Tax=Streptococcus ovis TaxID=82806 RepID=UPI0003784DB5|nr:hypothetical protein [Streptococcus ovis]